MQFPAAPTTPILSDLYHGMRVHRFDDLDETSSIAAGQLFAEQFDIIKEKYGPLHAIAALVPCYNEVYVNEGQIRDPDAPINRIMFERFVAYYQAFISRYTSSTDALIAILELTTYLQRSRARPLEVFLANQERKIVKKAMAELERKAKGGKGMEALKKIAYLTQLDVGLPSFERYRKKTSASDEFPDDRLKKTFKRIAYKLAKTGQAKEVARYCRRLNIKKQSSVYLQETAVVIDMRIRGIRRPQLRIT